MNQAYYNEIDPFAAEWLQNLIQAGLIMAGDIDQRDIRDVRPSDLRGYTRCHFFAGIGGWELALQLAGWPEDRPVWTGSCPCQPFSAAGKGAGFDDERHLWPSWHWLIEQSCPDTIFGEQVASNAGDKWLDLVRTDLEKHTYAIGISEICGASVGAPYGRRRNFFMADANIERFHRQYALLCAGQPIKNSFEIAGGRESAYAWKTGKWSSGADGRKRWIEPEIPLLDDGFSKAMGRLRAFGNAIVPQVGAQFIRAYLDA